MLTVKELIGPTFNLVLDQVAEWSKKHLDKLADMEPSLEQDDRQDFIIAACTAFGRTDPFLACFMGQIMLTYASLIIGKNKSTDLIMAQNECLNRFLLFARCINFVNDKDRENLDFLICGLNAVIYKKISNTKSALNGIEMEVLDRSILSMETMLGEIRRMKREETERREING